MKSDGSQFVGTVVRREDHSITLTGRDGEAHTFFYTELSDIQYPVQPQGGSVAGTPPAPSRGAPSASGAAPVAQVAMPASGEIQFAAGSVFPVRILGFVDSCCAPAGYVLMGDTDANILSGGKVVIPEGSHVTMTVRRQYVTDNRLHMQIELDSADFGGRHFVVSSAKGLTEEGATVTLLGAPAGSPDANLRGLNVHIENGALMTFTAANPTLVKLAD